MSDSAKQTGRRCDPPGGYWSCETGGRYHPRTCHPSDFQRCSLWDGGYGERFWASRSLYRSVPGRTGSRHPCRSIWYPDHEQTGIRRWGGGNCWRV
jgi:ABC-type spermidine/putrescine transport systems, ATPase components